MAEIELGTQVQITPLVSSDGRIHVMDDTCWCRPMVIARYWNGQDLVIHRPEQVDGCSEVPDGN
jgi:hypothetical protein